MNRFYYNVTEAEREKTMELVKKEIETMQLSLESALREGFVFANLNGNVFRVEDVKSITLENNSSALPFAK
jgi:hypothetical protein